MFLPSTSRKWNRESERKTRKTEGEQGLSPGVENVITESSLMFHSGCFHLSWLQNWASWLDFGWCLSLSALDCLLEKQWNLIHFFFCAFSNSVPCSSGWRQVLYAEWLTLAFYSWSPRCHPPPKCRDDRCVLPLGSISFLLGCSACRVCSDIRN